MARKLGITGLKIGIVTGDNLLGRIDELVEQGHAMENMETGQPIAEVKDSLLSANVYLGAMPIVEALRQGANIVITGRTTDTGLTMAPMIYEFGWSADDWDKLAAGTVAGHINECGAQATGGNFLGDLENIPDMEISVSRLSKHIPTVLLLLLNMKVREDVSPVGTISEQLMYEIGNPAEYITPDCIADFSTINIEDLGNDRVRVYGIKGKPATPFYKVSASYADGYTAFSSLT